MPLGIARLNTLSLETTHPAIGVSAAAATGLAMVDPNGDYVLEDESYSAGESAVDTMTFAFWMRFDASATSGEKYIFKFNKARHRFLHCTITVQVVDRSVPTDLSALVHWSVVLGNLI